MRTKIYITTPIGEAKKTQNKIKPWIIGFKKVKVDYYINDEDSQMVWDIDGNVRDILKINKSVALFDNVLKGIFNNKMVKKTVNKYLKEDDKVKLQEMLFNQTKVEIIKEATANEIVESNKTLWDNIKAKFHKI